MAITVNDQNFEQEVIKSDIPVLLVFEAKWCAACELIKPFINEIDKEYEGKVKVAWLDIDESPATTRRYWIHNFPTVMLFKKGEVTWTTVGYRPMSTFLTMVNS